MDEVIPDFSRLRDRVGGRISTVHTTAFARCCHQFCFRGVWPSPLAADWFCSFSVVLSVILQSTLNWKTLRSLVVTGFLLSEGALLGFLDVIAFTTSFARVSILL